MLIGGDPFLARPWPRLRTHARANARALDEHLTREVALRRYRSARRLATAFGREWLRHVRDGRVYPHWRQIGSPAGKITCRNPSVQQIPRGEYRDAVAAPPGKVLVSGDYSMIELRIAAKIAGEERLSELFRRGEDLHARMARRLLGKRTGPPRSGRSRKQPSTGSSAASPPRVSRATCARSLDMPSPPRR